MAQLVYVLTNPAMPNVVKIGRTTKQDVNIRMKELYTTGVPLPFECAFACEVKDATEVEKALHFAFGDARINESREFFKISAERVIAILKLLKIDSRNVTDEIQEQFEKISSDSDRAATQKFKIEEAAKKELEETTRKPRPVLNFQDMGISVGEKLVFINDQNITITVVDNKKVECDGEVSFLTPLTQRLLNRVAPIQPSPYWMYNGKILKDIYEEKYNEY
jgi:hypothetical protein